MLSKIQRLEEQVARPVSDDLYEKVINLQDKLKIYIRYKQVCEELCIIFKINPEHLEEIPIKSKILEKKYQSSRKSEEICVELCEIFEISPEHSEEIVLKSKEILAKYQGAKRSEEICNELCRDLDLTSSEDLIDKAKASSSTNKNAQKLYTKLAELLIQCSPRGKFSELPSCRHVWKWITKILEDYMIIKKDLSKTKQS